MKQPLVSIIIPSYNSAAYLPAVLDAVFAQTYSHFEVILVDDGSTDETAAVVYPYSDRLIYHRIENSGSPTRPRNVGIARARGELIAFCDSDDLFLPDKLQTQVRAMEGDRALGLVASGWTEVNAERRPLRTVRPWRLVPGLGLEDLLYHCMVLPSTVVVRRDWLERVGLFDAELRYVEDWDLWLRLAFAGCPMAWVRALVCLLTVHRDSKIRDVAAMSAGLFRMLDKFFARSDLPDGVRQQRDQVYARAHLDGMVRAFGAGMAGEGEGHLAAALRLNPALLDGEPPLVLQSLASAALTHVVGDAGQYVRDVCRSLPKQSVRLARSPREMRAIIRATAAFDDYANDRRMQARLNAVRALLTDPVWLRNRGLLGILLKP